MKKLFVPLLLGALLFTSCKSIDSTTKEWSSETKSLMINTIGEELPFVSFNKNTFEVSYLDNDESTSISLSDKGNKSIFKGYENKLVEKGYTLYPVYDNAYTYYRKDTEDGLLEVSFAYLSDSSEKGNYLNAVLYYPATLTHSLVFDDLDFNNSDDFTFYEVKDLIFTGDKGSNQYHPRLFHSGGGTLRFYNGNTLTINAGGKIKTIEFIYSNEVSGQLDSSVGTITNKVWSGKSKEVTFTNNTGSRLDITSVVVTYDSITDDEFKGNVVNTVTYDFTTSETADFEYKIIEGLSLTASQGTGDSNPKTYDSGDLRIYKDNTFSFTGEEMTVRRVIFTIDYKEFGTFTANSGNIVGLVWVGESNNLTFTLTSGQLRFKTIEVTYVINAVY